MCIRDSYITAPENVAWLLNIRGNDNPNSPIPNCHLFLDNKKNFPGVVSIHSDYERQILLD